MEDLEVNSNSDPVDADVAGRDSSCRERIWLSGSEAGRVLRGGGTPGDPSSLEKVLRKFCLYVDLIGKDFAGIGASVTDSGVGGLTCFVCMRSAKLSSVPDNLVDLTVFGTGVP